MLTYTLQNNLPVAFIQNHTGKFVKPTLDLMTAASTASQLLEYLCGWITSSKASEGYPIVGYTYLIAYQNMDNQSKKQALAEFMWAIHDSQQQARNLNYRLLPAEVVSKAEDKINQDA